MKNFATFSIMLLLLNGCVSYPSKNQSYQNLSYPKAMAVAIYPNGQLTGGWGIATGYSIDDAMEKAIRNCKSYNRSYSCIIQKENDFDVLDLNIAQFKTDNPYIPKNTNITPRNTNNQQIDWGRVAGVIGKDILDREQARTRPSPSPQTKKGLMYSYHSETISGTNKICWYKLGSQVATKTISRVNICPLSIFVE